MCRGMECGDGWFDRIDTLCSTIQFGIRQGDTPPVRVLKVKEKFGTLRFYIRGGNERARGKIDIAVAFSAFTLERQAPCVQVDPVLTAPGCLGGFAFMPVAVSAHAAH